MKNKNQKLIRNLDYDFINAERVFISDIKELNELYALKIREELAEIQASDHKSITGFAELLQVVVAFAVENGYTDKQLINCVTLNTGENTKLILI
jgi:hypothetical protein